MEHLVSFNEEVEAYRANPDVEEVAESDDESSSDSDGDRDELDPAREKAKSFRRNIGMHADDLQWKWQSRAKKSMRDGY